MLTAAEKRLLLAARKIFETGESLVGTHCGVLDYTQPKDISFWRAFDACEKYFQGSYAAYRVAKDRLERKLDAATERHGFWARRYLGEIGYNTEFYAQCSFGGGQILPGNVSHETFDNWCALVSMAYIDRILETGEIK